jgi:hypothetical protein
MMSIRVKFCCISIVAFLLLSGIAASVENFKYHPVRREIVQALLGKYKGNNQQREATLKSHLPKQVATINIFPKSL